MTSEDIIEWIHFVTGRDRLGYIFEPIVSAVLERKILGFIW